jgi:hypothetical protein
MKEVKKSTLKNSQDHGHILAIISEAVLIACRCSTKVHVYLYQIDMKIGRSEGVESSNEEVLTAAVRAQSIMISSESNNPIVNTVEAKLKLCRDNPGQPWRLQYVVIIFPDLYQGKCPQVFMMNASEDALLQELLNDRSKFYSEYPEGKAINRSDDSADLLRRSRLILGERVTPWEDIPLAVIQQPLKVVPVTEKRFSIIGFIRQLCQQK